MMKYGTMASWTTNLKTAKRCGTYMALVRVNGSDIFGMAAIETKFLTYEGNGVWTDYDSTKEVADRYRILAIAEVPVPDKETTLKLCDESNCDNYGIEKRDFFVDYSVSDEQKKPEDQPAPVESESTKRKRYDSTIGVRH